VARGSDKIRARAAVIVFRPVSVLVPGGTRRFENSRNVEMTSQVSLLEEWTMVSKALRSLLVSRLCLSQ
jgi:hypothetical protein